MMRKQPAILFLLLAFALTCLAQDKPEIYAEKKAGFSFELPKGWQIEKETGGKYRSVYGPRKNNFTPNISIDDESCACTLAEYVAAAQRTLEADVKSTGLDAVKLVSKTEFSTSAGVKGWKVTNEGKAPDMSLLMWSYVFDGKSDVKLIFTCGSLIESAAQTESDCDSIIKTLKFDK